MSTSSNSGNSTSLYGEASTPIPDSSGNVVVRGDLYVLSGNILTTATTGNIFPANATTINLGLAATSMNIGAATGTTTINNALTAGGTVTAPGADFGNITIGVATDNTITTTSGDLAITATGSNGVEITSGTTAPTSITRTTANTNVAVRSLALSVQSSGTPAAGFGNSLEFEVETAPGNTERAGFISVVSTDVTPTSEDFSMSFGLMTAGAAATTKMSLNNAGDLQIDGDLTVDGTDINLAQGTSFLYSEANSRFNRPTIQSTTGNTSGLRVAAPNTGSSAQGLFSVLNSSDNLNAEFLQMGARGSALSNTFRFLTGEYIAGVLGPTNKSISFVDDTNLYATVNPAGPTIGTDLTTKTYVDAAVAGGVTSITGTANQVIASSPTGAVTLSLPQDIDTTSSVIFNTVTADLVFTDEVRAKTDNINVTTQPGNKASLGLNENVSYPNGLAVITVNSNGWYFVDDGSTQFPNYTFPAADGAVNTILTTDGAGNVSWLASAGNVLSVTGGTHVTASPTTGAVIVTTDATDANTASTIVARDASGDFSAGVGTFTTVATPAVTYTGGALTITGGGVAPSALTIDDYQTTLALDGGVGYGDSTLTTAFNTLTWDHTAGGSDPGSVNGIWNLNSDGTTDFPNYTFPYADGTASQVLQTDGTGNLSWYSPADLNTTYDFNATSTSGGANLNLVGSDATTDTVKLTDGGHITAAYTSGTAITLGSDATDANTASTIVARDASGNFAASGATLGNVTVGVDSDQTISTTSGNLILQTAAGVDAGTITMASGANGNITVDPNGTGVIVFDSVQRLRGEAQASTNNSYVFPPATLTTVTDNNGYSAASSFEPGTNGYGANAQYLHYYGDTLAATNAAPSLNFKVAEGNSVTGVNIPWTGVNSVAPSAILSGTVLGTHNFNGYATSAFSNDIATQYQGGGISTSHIIQTQGYAAENLVDGTLTLTSANITAVASSFRVALTTPAVTGTKGQISFGATTPGVGGAIRVTGTLTGTATGIASGQNYWIIATNGTTTATLSATPNGNPITTTAGTLTGLTLTRCGVTFTLAGQTSYPFGRNALVTVANVTNVTDGTYPVSSGVSSLTSISLGIPHTVAPTLPGTQQFSIATVTNGGGGYRIRAYPLATPMNPANRLNIVDHTPASCTLRANTFTLNTGAYANTGVGVTGNNIVYNRVYGQFEYNTTVTPAAADTAEVFPLGTASINNIVTVGSTSRLIAGASGIYNLQFSVQVDNADNANDHDAYIWLRKNGTDVVGSMGRTTVAKNNAGSLKIIAWNYLVSSANTTDYWEIAYAVSDTDVTFPAFAATAFGPSTATIITSLTPVGA